MESPEWRPGSSSSLVVGKVLCLVCSPDALLFVKRRFSEERSRSLIPAAPPAPIRSFSSRVAGFHSRASPSWIDRGFSGSKLEQLPEPDARHPCPARARNPKEESYHDKS